MSSLMTLLQDKKSGRKKLCLKLLTAVVMQGPECAKELLFSFDFNFPAFTALWDWRSRQVTSTVASNHDISISEVFADSIWFQSDQDLRTLMLMFALSFFMEGDTACLKQLVLKKGISIAVI